MTQQCGVHVCAMFVYANVCVRVCVRVEGSVQVPAHILSDSPLHFTHALSPVFFLSLTSPTPSLPPPSPATLVLFGLRSNISVLPSSTLPSEPEHTVVRERKGKTTRVGG